MRLRFQIAPRDWHRPFASLVGLALGFSIAVGYLPGGYDAFTFYLRAPAVDTTAPAWVYLLTYPLSFLGWPLGWQVLTLLTVLAAGAAALLWGNWRWWIVLVTPPLLWNLWLGQIELFSLLGLILTRLILDRKIHPVWLGVSWLFLLAKPQVGLGVLVLQGLWLGQDRAHGKRAFLYGLGLFVALIALTVALWPSWILNWVTTMRTFTPTWWNAAVWPYGVVAWPIAIWASVQATPLQKVRLFSAASLLGSPYFALYHCLLLLSVTDNRLAGLISWMILLIGWSRPEQWMPWGWLLPTGILVMDVTHQWLARRSIRVAAAPPA